MEFRDHLVGQHDSLEVRCWSYWDCDSRIVHVGDKKGSWRAKVKRCAFYN